VGSFVAAKEATLPLFDRLFTRIGASDSLSEGLSTFMVEMKETAEMLESATEKSLVILDEVGRGTSTYDGMSLAQAILEHILESRRSMTLFATHYHEMTELSQLYPQLHNGHMSIHEKNGEITFLHQLTSGPANKSYGIHVGKLAGLPSAVTRRAGQILKKLEAGRVVSATPQMSMLGFFDQELSGASETSGFDVSDERMDGETLSTAISEAMSTEEKEVFESIKGIDLSRLTPLEAINRLAEWQRLLGSTDVEGTKV
jgi:DNA mismatch repair protein MutS